MSRRGRRVGGFVTPYGDRGSLFIRPCHFLAHTLLFWLRLFMATYQTPDFFGSSCRLAKKKRNCIAKYGGSSGVCFRPFLVDILFVSLCVCTVFFFRVLSKKDRHNSEKKKKKKKYPIPSICLPSTQQPLSCICVL